MEQPYKIPVITPPRHPEAHFLIFQLPSLSLNVNIIGVFACRIMKLYAMMQTIVINPRVKFDDISLKNDDCIDVQRPKSSTRN